MKKTIIAILALLLAAFGGNQVAQLGGSPGSLPADFATSSTVAIGQASVVVLFPATASVRPAALCASRTITTKVDSIYISFNNTATATLQASDGHFQAASTTTNYPAEQYGCDDWIVKGATAASSSISISETRQ